VLHQSQTRNSETVAEALGAVVAVQSCGAAIASFFRPLRTRTKLPRRLRIVRFAAPSFLSTLDEHLPAFVGEKCGLRVAENKMASAGDGD
jgi:hypothetical protein